LTDELDPSTARAWPKGHTYDEFTEGRVFEHHWGRTITESDNTLFTTLTLAYNPLYFNESYARDNGHDSVVVNPMLVFGVVFGLSVEDLSERGGLFLGVDDLTFHKTVYPGDTLTSRSTVVSRRESGSRPDSGIVTWHTEGFNQRGELVIDYKRTNLVSK
jgi:itaconyl-CoA hydratase